MKSYMAMNGLQASVEWTHFAFSGIKQTETLTEEFGITY